MEGALGLSVTGVIIPSIALMDLMKPTAMVGSVCLCRVCVCACVRVCVRAYVRTCVRACVRACVCSGN